MCNAIDNSQIAHYCSRKYEWCLRSFYASFNEFDQYYTPSSTIRRVSPKIRYRWWNSRILSSCSMSSPRHHIQLINAWLSTLHPVVSGTTCSKSLKYALWKEIQGIDMFTKPWLEIHYYSIWKKIEIQKTGYAMDHPKYNRSESLFLIIPD